MVLVMGSDGGEGSEQYSERDLHHLRAVRVASAVYSN